MGLEDISPPKGFAASVFSSGVIEDVGDGVDTFAWTRKKPVIG